MIELSPRERAELRARAHSLHPVVSVGQHGLTAPVLREIDLALTAHELVKVRVHSDARDERATMLEEVARALKAAPVQHLGKLLIFWRPKPVEPVPESRPAKGRPARRARGKPGAVAPGGRSAGSPSARPAGGGRSSAAPSPRRKAPLTRKQAATLGKLEASDADVMPIRARRSREPAAKTVAGKPPLRRRRGFGGR